MSPWKPLSHAQRLRRQRDDREYDERRRHDPVLRWCAQIRDSERWHRMRILFRARNPVCQECERRGRPVPMDQVDHIVPLRDLYPDIEAAFRWENLQSLCAACHAAKSAEERAVG